MRLYNNYFFDIAFQELREARGLAYSVYSGYTEPKKKDQYYTNMSFIGTQNDKLPIAVEQFKEILTNLPVSTESFEVTKLNVENKIRTTRITKENVLWSYHQAQLLGLDQDINKKVFEQLPGVDFLQIRDFHDQYIKSANYNYCLLGNINELDMNFVNSMGSVKRISLEGLFGY